MIKITPAKPADSQAIRRLETKVWGVEVVNKYDVAMFVRFGYAFVAKDKGKIVGAICSYLTRDNEVYVCDWVVDKKYRGKNVGVSLYRKLIERVKGTAIISFIDVKNGASIKAHKKLGFKMVKKIKDPHQVGEGMRWLARLQNKRSHFKIVIPAKAGI